jgi:FkbM family methyltransferase
VKPLLKKTLAAFGYTLITKKHFEKLRHDLRLPLANMAALPLALDALYPPAPATTPPTILQVGACDGLRDDPLHHFLTTRPCRAHLLEPLPENFQRLQNTYAAHPHITLHCEALTDTASGTATLHVPEGGGDIKTVASFDPTLHKVILIDEIRYGPTRPVEVRTITITDFCRREHITHFHIIQIDAEGMDARLVTSILRAGLRPAILNFEHLHIKTGEVKPLFTLLETCGYHWLHDNLNTCCIKKSPPTGEILT